LAGSLSCRGPIEVSQPVAVQLRRVPSRAPVDLNRSANWPQLQLIAHPNSALIDKRLRQRDLKLAGHLCHGLIVSPIKDRVKDAALIHVLEVFALGFWRMRTRMPTIQFQCQ
jgi:hypothetical protein